MEAINRMKKEIILDSSKDFTVVIHACLNNYDSDNQFQWYMVDTPDFMAAEEITGATDESVTFSSETIRKKLKKKYIFCLCTFPDKKILSEYIYMTDDFVEMVRNNQFDIVSFFGSDGMLKEEHSYEKTYDCQKELMQHYQGFVEEMLKYHKQNEDREKGEFCFELRRWSKREPFWCILAFHKKSKEDKIYGHCGISNENLGNLHTLLSMLVRDGCKCEVSEKYFLEDGLYGL